MKLALLTLVFLLFLHAPAAHASSCTRSCEVNCTGAENESACASSCSSNCLDVIENNNSNSSGPARTSYGAIAVSSSTLKYGYSWGQNTQDQANAVAFQNCVEADCKIEVYFYNACGALAMTQIGGENARWGTAWAGSKSAAEQAALNYCAQAGGTDCVIEASVCSN